MMFTHEGVDYHGGWTPRPEEVDRILGTLPMPRAEGAACLGAPAPTDIFFWDAEQEALQKLLPTWDQGQIGSCVSHGCGRAAQDVLVLQMATGDLEEFDGEVAREPIYGGSKVQVGGEHTYQDGSVGAWASKWLNQWGIILYGSGQGQLSGYYDVGRCKQWGHDGVPDNFQSAAKLHAVNTITQVNTPEQAVDLLRNGYPIEICGSKGRTMQRQPGGWCPVRGSWDHCQCLRGTGIAKGGKPFVVYCNSWGDYLGSTNNTVDLESGKQVTLPPGHYLSTLDEIASELAQGDSFAYSHAVGYPARNFSWAVA